MRLIVNTATVTLCVSLIASTGLAITNDTLLASTASVDKLPDEIHSTDVEPHTNTTNTSNTIAISNSIPPTNSSNNNSSVNNTNINNNNNNINNNAKQIYTTPLNRDNTAVLNSSSTNTSSNTNSSNKLRNATATTPNNTATNSNSNTTDSQFLFPLPTLTAVGNDTENAIEPKQPAPTERGGRTPASRNATRNRMRTNRQDLNNADSFHVKYWLASTTMAVIVGAIVYQ